MSDTRDSATLARLWIEANVALFVVLVIAAVLLVVALLTLIFYCWCCRRKIDHWQLKKDKPDGSQIDLHGNSMDAESAVTAAIRGPATIELQMENKHHHPDPDYPQQLQASQQMSASNAELVVSQEKMWVQHAERPQEVAAPDAVELRLHHQPLPDVRTRHAAAESELEMKLQSPRTMVIPEAQLSSRRSHGNSVYQSDDNEITIVDSDFSDYEDSRSEGVADKAGKGSKTVKASAAQLPWETLPNQSTQELPIRAINREGTEYVPAPALSLAEERARRAQNLAELDRTLDVFAQQAEAGTGGYRQEAEPSSGEFVDEEEIQALDRSQVLFGQLEPGLNWV